MCGSISTDWEAHGEAGIYDRIGTHQVRRTVGWLEARIRAALNEPDRTNGVRKIAEEFGVNPTTARRPLGASAAAA